MHTRFSKPLQDIADKSQELTKTDGIWLERIRRAASVLDGRPTRETCTVCNSALANAVRFVHRGHVYCRCRTCSHILLGCLPPEEYPSPDQDGFSFNALYPPQDAGATAKLRRCVYQPKLDWILDAAALCGRSRQSLLDAVWVELGCGSGQFLAALQSAGVECLEGYEADSVLAARANYALGGSKVIHSKAPLCEVIREANGDVYCAFFVLEHVSDINDLFVAIAEKPTGTIFAFSVPVFSMATVFESAFDIHSPRNLDSVMHTQLFTDASIHKCLEIGRLTPISQWVFGQDASDFRRLLALALDRVYPEEMRSEVDCMLSRMEESLQEIFDKWMCCDARHVLAVRK